MASVPSPISLAAASNVFSLRPVIATCAPSCAYALATPNPIPLLPPVTTATLPLNRCALIRLLLMLARAGPRALRSRFVARPDHVVFEVSALGGEPHFEPPYDRIRRMPV